MAYLEISNLWWNNAHIRQDPRIQFSVNIDKMNDGMDFAKSVSIAICISLCQFLRSLFLEIHTTVYMLLGLYKIMETIVFLYQWDEVGTILILLIISEKYKLFFNILLLELNYVFIVFAQNMSLDRKVM